MRLIGFWGHFFWRNAEALGSKREYNQKTNAGAGDFEELLGEAKKKLYARWGELEKRSKEVRK
jgi:hypothetical protein